MATLVKHKSIGPAFQKEEEIVRVVYDFAADGGAMSALDIMTAASDIIITSFHAYVKTAGVSGGSATLKVGITGDDDVFMTTTQGAVANLTLGAMIAPVPVLTEGTPNTIAMPLPVKLASGAKVLQTIGGATLTAGKVEYVLKYVSA